jgi:hypothetical protein
VLNRYCGKCHQFHDERNLALRSITCDSGGMENQQQQFNLHTRAILDAFFITRIMDLKYHNHGADLGKLSTADRQQIIADGCAWSEAYLQQQGQVLQQGVPYGQQQQDPVGAGRSSGFGTRERT